MAGRFDGKVALVTAAVDGIGAATAQAFGENGARVILADINADRGIRVNCIAPGVTPLRAHNLPIDGGCTAQYQGRQR
ncbi:MAG TPA: SDR family NAD(P)-dependent oxidoreductase [Rhizorhapis sp.]|jgi:NAD(P)-dependent dehydrogenase (short-subunit alcohol dehydrogenase family)